MTKIDKRFEDIATALFAALVSKHGIFNYDNSNSLDERFMTNKELAQDAFDKAEAFILLLDSKKNQE